MADETKNVIWKIIANFSQARSEADKTTKSFEALSDAQKKNSASSTTADTQAAAAADKRSKTTEKLSDDLVQLTKEEAANFAATQKTVTTQKQAQQVESQRTSGLKGLLAALGQAGAAVNANNKAHQSYVNVAAQAAKADRDLRNARLAQQSATVAEAKAADGLNLAYQKLNTVKKDAKATSDDVTRAETALEAAHLAAARAAGKLEQATSDVDSAMRSAGGSNNNFTNSLRGLKSGFGDVGKGAKELAGLMGLLKFAAFGASIGPLVNLISALAAGFVGLASAIAPAVGALATLPALFAGAGVGIGAMLLGFGGVVSTLKAYSQQQKAATTETQKAASAQETAAKRAASAATAQRSAQIEQINNAKSLRDAEQSLADARQTQANTFIDNAQKIRQAQQDLATAQRSAADQEISDTEAVATAQRNLQQAEQDAAAAEKAMGDARKAAKQNIIDLQNQLKSLQLQEEGSSLSLAQAQQAYRRALNDPNSTDLDRREALFQVQSAQQSVNDTHQQAAQTQSQLNDAQKKGIDSSDAVTQARQAEAAANQKVIESEQELADAKRKSSEDELQSTQAIQKAQQNLSNTQRDAAQSQAKSSRDVANAVQNLADLQKTQALQAKNSAQSVKDAAQAAKDAADAMNNATPKTNAYKDALAKLTPAGQAFVKQLIAMKPLLDKLKATTQNGILPGASTGLKDIATLFPIINKGLGQAAKAIGGDFAKAGKELTTGPWKRDLPKLFTSNAKLTSLFGDAVIALLNIFRSVATAAIPLTEWLAKTVTLWLQNKAAAAEAAEQNGKMAKFFDKTRDVLSKLGSIFHNIGQALYNTGKAGSDFGRDLLDSLDKLTKRWADWTQTVQGQNSLKKWYDGARPVLTETGKLIGAISEGFSKLGSSSATAAFIRQLRTQLGPAVEKLLQDLSGGDIGKSLITFLTNLVNLVDTMVSNGGGSLNLLIRAFSDFFKVINTIIQITPGGTKILAAFLTTFAVFKVAKILSMVSGLSSLVKVLKDYKKAQAGVAGAEGIGAAIAGLKGGGGIGGALSSLFGIGGLKGQTTKEMEGVAEAIEAGGKGPIAKAVAGLGGIFSGVAGVVTKPLKSLGSVVGGVFSKALKVLIPGLGGITGEGVAAGGSMEVLGGSLAGVGAIAAGVALPLIAIGGAMFYMWKTSKEDVIPTFDQKLYPSLVKQYDATGNNVKGYQNLQKAVGTYAKKAQTQIGIESQLRSSYGLNAQQVQQLTNKMAINQRTADEAGADYTKLTSKLNTFNDNISNLQVGLGLSQGSVLKFADALNINLGDASKKTTAKIGTIVTNVDTLQSQFGITEGQALSLAGKLGINLTKGLDQVTKSGKTGYQVISDYYTQLQLADSPAAKLANDASVLADNSETADTKLQSLTDAIGIFTGKAIDAGKADDDFQTTMNDLTTTLKTNKGALDGNSQGAIDNRQAIRDAVSAAATHATAVYKETGSLQKAGQTFQNDIKKVRDNATAVTGNKTAVDKLTGSTSGIVTQFDRWLKHAQKAASGTKKALDENLGGGKKGGLSYKINIDAEGNVLTPNLKGGPKLLPRAEGGYVFGPGGPRDDAIPAALSDGEFVVNAAATSQFGPLLESINNFGRRRRYANGGYVKKFADGGAVTADPFVQLDYGNMLPPTKTTAEFAQGVVQEMLDNAKKLVEAEFNPSGGGSLLNYAKKFIGVPYIWGGSDPHGFDCSGLTSYVMHHFGINSPRTAAQQQDWAIPESKSAAKPGDLVFWGDPAHHVAFYYGGGKILEAPQPGELVKIANLYDSPTFGRERGLKTGELGSDIPGGDVSAHGTSAKAAQDVARKMLSAFGYAAAQMAPLISLWNGESGWNYRATNPSSGAYGIPQSLPGNKMAAAGSDWRTNPATQIRWGLGYIRDVYGSPSAAYAEWLNRSPHWYATGGQVPGMGDRDTVPAMLTPGEFVLNKKAVKRLGVSRLHAINETPGYAGNGSGLQHFHTGGYVNGFQPSGHGPYIRALRWEEGLSNWNFQGWDQELTAALKRRFPRPLAQLPKVDASRLIQYLQHVAGHKAGGAKTSFTNVASHFSHYKQMNPIQVIEAAALAQAQASEAQAVALRKASDFSAAQFDKLDQLQRTAERNPGSKADAAAVTHQQHIASRAAAAHAAISSRAKPTSMWEQIPKNTKESFLAGVRAASTMYHTDVKSLQHHAALTQTGKWTSSMNGPIDHILDHGLKIPHDKWAPRPWNPLTAAEQAEEDQERANTLQAEFDGYLETFATWGLTALVNKLLDLGPADGLDIARSAVKNKTVATNLNKAYAVAAALDPDTEHDMLNMIALLSNSTTPVGIRAVATSLQIPDYAVIDLWDKIGDQVKQKIASNKLTKLLGDIASFRAGTFYANSGGQVPGNGDGDTVPAMLTPGEFVLKKNVARFLGVSRLDRLNNNPTQYFANGGLVMAAPSIAMVGSTVSTAGISARGDSAPQVVNTYINTEINNPTGEDSVASFNKNIRRKAALGAFSGSN